MIIEILLGTLHLTHKTQYDNEDLPSQHEHLQTEQIVAIVTKESTWTHVALVELATAYLNFARHWHEYHQKNALLS